MKKYPELLKIVLLLLTAALLASGCGGSAKKDRKKAYLRESEPVLSSGTEKGGESSTAVPKKNPYSDLSVPTQVNRIGDTWFIVDCYHDQVIFHDNLKDPLNEWEVMTDQMSRGHTVAGDGEVYLVDDTENERIMILERSGEGFAFTQQFSGISGRPHYIIYNEEDHLFYAWCSTGGQMLLFEREEGTKKVFLKEIRSIPELDGIYVRSFTIVGNEILFVSGRCSIIRADRETFRILEEYPVPESMAGMVQITPIDGMYYITISTDASWNQDFATIIRTPDLAGPSRGEYEDIYGHFIGGGTPYYITEEDGTYYMTEHRIPGHSVWSFRVREGEILSETVY